MKTVRYLLAVLLGIAVAACGGGGGTNTTSRLVSIQVTPGILSIAKDSTSQFTATGVYSDNTTKDLTASVTWASNNPGVATVSGSGLATGVAGGGPVTITATSAGVSGTASLTVTAATLVSIQVTPATASIAKGTTQQFTATGVYSDNTTQDLTATASWVSSNAGTATVSAGGLATGIAVGGPVTVTATSAGVSGAASLTVTAATLVTIQVTPATVSIANGTTQQLTATGFYSDNTTQDLTATTSWLSSDTGIAAVSASGLATGVAVGGSITITATSAGVSGTASLTVTAATLVSIQVTATVASVKAGIAKTDSVPRGKSGKVTASAASIAKGAKLFQGAAQVTPTIAGIAKTVPVPRGKSGKVAGSAASIAKGATPSQGTAQATPTIASIARGVKPFQGTAQAKPSIASIAKGAKPLGAAAATASITKGTTQQFTATGVYSDNTTQDLTATASWVSSDSGIATVSASGLATGIAVGGPVTITATYAGVSGTASLTVTAATLVSIQVTPAAASIAKGTTQQLTATGFYSDNTTQDLTATSSWVSNTAAVTVSASGLATGIGVVGSATVTATYAGVSGTASLTVTAATLVSIQVTPAATSFAKGTQQLTATGIYTDNNPQDLTAVVSWVSSDTSIVTVSASGLATGVAVGGPVTVTATLAGVSGSSSLTVTPAALKSISVTGRGDLAIGATVQLAASGGYSDFTSQDLTGAVSWVSSDPSKATVSASGLVTGVAAGTVYVYATYAGVSGAALMAVAATVPVSEGYSGAPAVIAAMPYNGQVGLGGSWYAYTTVGSVDSITLTITSGYAPKNIYIYKEALFYTLDSNWVCTTLPGSYFTVGTCTATAPVPAGTVLYIRVGSYPSEPGSMFTLAVSDSITMPYSGAIDSVTPQINYTYTTLSSTGSVQAKNLSDDVDVYVVDSTFTQLNPNWTCTANTGTTTDICTATTPVPAGTVLNLAILNYTVAGGSFTLDAVTTPLPLGVNAITMPYSGAIDSVTPQNNYTYTTARSIGYVRAYNMSDDVDVYVVDPTFTYLDPNWACTANTGKTEDTCTAATPVPAGTVLSLVVMNHTVSGGNFSLNISPTGPVSEGLAGAPIVLVGMPRRGQVGNNGVGSAYAYTTVGSADTITLTNLTDDVDIFVFTDASFTAVDANWSCTQNVGATPDSCTATTPVPPGTVLYIAAYNYTVGGSYFELNILAAAGPASEGVAGAPAVIAAMPYNGQVGSLYGSAYAYSPVGSVGTITATNMTDDVDIWVFTDANFTTVDTNWSCTQNVGTTPDSCTATTPVSAGTVLYVAAYNYTVAGGTYTLNVAP